LSAFDEVVSLRTQDLRPPLASIVDCAELMGFESVTDNQCLLYGTVILREARRLVGLIDNALTLQGLETGQRELEVAPVDLHSLIQRAVIAAGEDDARPILVDVTGELPLVAADPEAILGALANFLANARRFSPDGGAINIEARLVGDMVEVQIRDHGVGIDANVLPKLFDKFYRPEPDVRSTGRGAGLGLPLNQRVIENQGGRVEASSNGPGRGSRFEFTLPLSRPESAAADILVVEDDARFARLIKAAFAARGLTTVRADDAETAERLLTNTTPRAIVLGLALPVVQPDPFLAYLRTRGDRRVPVVVLTAEDMTEVRISALQAAGVMAVLPKEAGAPQAAAALIAEELAAEPAAR
jgi:CheY-like chemotaxis protein